MEQITPNVILLADCVEGMSKFPPNSFDLAIADPPYNLSKGGNWSWDSNNKLSGFGGDWKKVMQSWDNMTLSDYLAFTMAWLKELKRLVKPTGSIWVHGTYHNIGIINIAMQLLEIEMINEVVWFKRNSFPNLSGRRLTASHESIIWAHTGGEKNRKYLFNYEKSKELCFPEDKIKVAGKQMRTVWDIPNNKSKEELAFGDHPTQKPLRLITRMLQISAKPGDLCIIPFAGIGSECVAVKRYGMNFVGFEIDPSYYEIALNRLGSEVQHSFVNPVEVDKSSDKTKKTSNSSVPRQKTLVELETEKVEESSAEYKIEPSETTRQYEPVPSLIKWSGSKRSQAASIRRCFPSFKRYFEPFLGSGALLYLVAPAPAIASDIYQPLIDYWCLIKNNVEELIARYAAEWESLQTDFPTHYYTVRERFNNSQNPFDLSFLARTCVNGIIRFNANGEFNNSIHLSRRGMTPSNYEKIARAWSKKVQSVEFFCCDYQISIEQAKKGDFIYFDPPYAGSNNRYVENLDLNRFYCALELLNKKGISWALSFDGFRGADNLLAEIPRDLYRRHILLSSGHSKVKNVLSKQYAMVQESLYMNY